MTEPIVSKKALEESQSAEAHSSLGASSAYRWIECPGSVAKCDWYRETYGAKETEYAKLGTAVHAMCEYSLLHDGEDYPQEEAEGVKVDDHMRECARTYARIVLGDLKKHGGTLHVEEKFDLSWVYPGMFGRNDSCIEPSVPLSVLRVYDYKNGRQPVYPANNPQCMYYALGKLGEKNPHAVTGVEIVIIQPNCPGKACEERWFVSAADLYRWKDEVLRPAAERASKADAPLVPGEHCFFCDYLPCCEARRGEALAALDVPSTPALKEKTLPLPADVPDSDLGRLSRFFGSQAFSKWIKSIQEEEVRRLQDGIPVPGRKLVEIPGRASRVWADEKEAEAVLVGSLGLDGAYTHDLLSPAQAEKAYRDRLGLKPKKVKALLDPVVTTLSTPKLTAVDEDDARPAVSGADAKKAIEMFN